MRASDIMAADPLCVTADTPPDEVAYLMSERRVGSVIIKDGDGHTAGDLYGY
ncbi:CBS domain-containing protein [Pseudomonas sp. MYb185]|uniref:CBS domain-containing protein n=1 Tax=Pseudomonas sp. MYb185 TaxID=1848729 RepID=UPI001C467BEA|nr:CBS domain-containing protein [Pseudomonas sp. MYb185]